MDLNHRFHVPTDLDETWAHFQDVAGLAGCFPGAQVTSVDGDDFTGTCKVKLGPIALVYNGTGVFLDRDEAAHRMTVEAKGKDKRGNGTASARATLTMSPAGPGGTDVEVVTDLSITGKPAQFGRGLIQDVSDKLLGQFVSCLEQQLTEPVAEPAADPASGPAEGPAAGSAEGPAGQPPAAADPELAQVNPEPAPVPASPPRAPAPRRPAPAQSDDALNLGAAVLPVLAKHYWKQGAAGIAAVAVLVWVVRRR